MPDLHLNADYSVPVTIDTQAMDWQSSPSGTVWRKRLHLSGPAEAGVVTSIVRYEKGAEFHSHDHPDGEEIFVLEGTFSDEHGDWPAGTYLLNPEGFRHAPFSRNGCLLFVKLRQYAGARPQLSLMTHDALWQASDAASIAVKPLYQSPDFPDEMLIERWSPGARAKRSGPIELLLVAGSAMHGDETLGEGTWLRWPAGQVLDLSTTSGCEFFVKRGYF